MNTPLIVSCSPDYEIPFAPMNEQSNDPLPWWMETLACPRCREPMQSVTQCGKCGVMFGSDDGTPVVIAKDAVGAVSFLFPQRRSEKTDQERQDYIRYPKFFEGKLNAPYHLDRAHAEVLLKLEEGARILEIGCGGGQMRTWFAGRGMKYIGTDVSKTRVFEWLQAHGGPDMLCDAHFLPFQDQQFDAVYTAAVTEHVACPIRYAQEVRRVLKPGAYFLGNTAFLEPWHDSSHFHSSPDGVLELLLEADFQVDAIWPGRGYHTFKALPNMIFGGPFRVVCYFSWIPMALYRLQCGLRSLNRRLRGEAPIRPIIADAKIAGAVDWIARRPTSK